MAFQISYRTVLELSIWHHHFLDPVAGPIFTPPPTVVSPEQTRLLLEYDVRNFFKIQPTQESRETIKQLGLIYQNTNRGCLIAAKDSYTESDPGVKVSFVIAVTDSEFFNYTNFDFNEIGDQIFYLTNFGLPPPAPRTLLTDAAGNPHLRDIHRNVWRPRILRMDQMIPGTANVDVFDLNTSLPDQVLALEIENALGQPPAYEIDCRSLREGFYRLESPNITNSEFFLGLENRGGILGVIEFYLENLNNAQYDIRLAKN